MLCELETDGECHEGRMFFTLESRPHRSALENNARIASYPVGVVRKRSLRTRLRRRLCACAHRPLVPVRPLSAGTVGGSRTTRVDASAAERLNSLDRPSKAGYGEQHPAHHCAIRRGGNDVLGLCANRDACAVRRRNQQRKPDSTPAFTLFRNDPQHLFDGGDPLRGFVDAVLAHREHALAPRLLLELVRCRVFHHELFDGRGDRQCFVDADAA